MDNDSKRSQAFFLLGYIQSIYERHQNKTKACRCKTCLAYRTSLGHVEWISRGVKND